MRFAHPIFLILAVPVVVGMILYQLFVWRGGTVRFSDVRRLKKTGAGGWSLGRSILLLLRAVAVTLLFVAVARPQTSIVTETIESEGVDIVLTLDISTSMKALDLDPAQKMNRLEVAKVVAEEFIDGRRFDRIGLVSFAAHDQTVCPLTIDHAALKQFLSKVTLTTPDRDGTALGDALARTLRRLKDSEAGSKVVILLTDGLDNRSNMSPLTSAEIAKTLGVRVYTIGAGTEGRAFIKVDHPVFGPRMQTIEAKIDEETLREIARITGGKYFRARDWRALSDVFTEIDDLERTEFESQINRRFKEVFSFAAFPALGLLIIEILLAHTILRKIP